MLRHATTVLGYKQHKTHLSTMMVNCMMQVTEAEERLRASKIAYEELVATMPEGTSSN
jgi:hypothetical protein